MGWKEKARQLALKYRKRAKVEMSYGERCRANGAAVALEELLKWAEEGNEAA